MSTASPTKFDHLVSAFRDRSLLKTAEIQQLGISREYVRRLMNTGRLERVSRGLYRLPDADIGSNHSVAEAAKLVPNGVVCLLSALRVHRITTQSPFEVWMAVESGDWQSKSSDVPIRFIRPFGPAFHEGIEHIDVDGVDARVYSLAKTVVDCFKYRSKIGLDVALEALRESLRKKRVSVDDLWRYAKICRVTNVMRPYLEAMD